MMKSKTPNEENLGIEAGGIADAVDRLNESIQRLTEIVEKILTHFTPKP